MNGRAYGGAEVRKNKIVDRANYRQRKHCKINERINPAWLDGMKNPGNWAVRP